MYLHEVLVFWDFSSFSLDFEREKGEMGWRWMVFLMGYEGL